MEANVFQTGALIGGTGETLVLHYCFDRVLMGLENKNIPGVQMMWKIVLDTLQWLTGMEVL